MFLACNAFSTCLLMLPLILYIFCDTQKSWIFFFFLWNELEKPPLSRRKLSVDLFIVMAPWIHGQPLTGFGVVFFFFFVCLY